MVFKEMKEREREQRRNIIIDAAEKLFFTKGYDSISMEDISSEINLSKAALYRYFDNKESIFFAIILRATKILVVMYSDAIDRVQAGIDKVIAYRDVADAFAKQYPDYHKACTFAMSGRFNSPTLMTNPDVQEMISLVTGMFINFCRSIQSGIDDKTIRPDINPVELAVFLSLISDGLTNLRPDLGMILDSRGINRDQFSQNMKQLITVMIANPSSVDTNSNNHLNQE